MGLTKQEKARREARIVEETERDTDIPPTMGQLQSVELPKVRTLPELFLEMRQIADLSKLDRRPGEYFCSANPVGHWYVVPTPAVKGVIDKMHQGVGLHFKIVMRDSGTALVTACYDQIIGGRWLAIIDGAKVRTASKRGGA